MIISTEEFIKFIKDGEKNSLVILKEFLPNDDDVEEVTE